MRAAQRITRGTFVCEYIGEVLDDCEANKRGERYISAFEDITLCENKF